MKRMMKGLHTFGSIGMTGGYLTFLVLLYAAEARPPAEALVLREAISRLFTVLIVPSVALALVTGLLAMAVHHAFMNAGWVWLKLSTTVVALEGSFGMQARAREIEALVRALARGEGDARELAGLAAREKGALAMLLVIAVANVVLGVWRPKLQRPGGRPAIRGAPAASED
jgi:uncharacterized membrane protein